MKKKIFLGFQIFIFIVSSLLATAVVNARDKDAGKFYNKLIVAADTEKEITATMRLNELIIGEGAALTAPDGYSLTMTVNGIETGQRLETWAGFNTVFVPGTYRGDIVITVVKANDVTVAGMGGSTTYPYRQALYLDDTGIVEDMSVLAAVKGKNPSLNSFDIRDIKITSRGSFYQEDTATAGGTVFNGIYAAGGTYNLKNVKIDLFGDGRSDFVGLGSAIVATGTDTKLVMDNVDIKTQGVVRAGIIAKDGSKIIVKNSSIETADGILPSTYTHTMDTSQMRSTLWISGMTGNCRATSVLGTGTEATYINSSIFSENWGALSTDSCSNPYLTAINCKVGNTGDSGYANYNDSTAHVAYYGCEIDVATFASAIGSGDVTYGASTAANVAQINTDRDLGLTAKELKSIKVKPTVINSKTFGVMWHRSGNPLYVTGGTIFNTKLTTFIISGVAATLDMDGGQINAGNGIIMQVASDDQPAASPAGFADSYDEATTPPVAIDGFDNTSVDGAATANFSNIKLKGDFYNSVGWGTVTDKLNMALNFDNSSITGVISASESHHASAKITIANLEELHHITDTTCPAINNGVIVTLTNGSNWTVTGTSYLTKLVIDADAKVKAPKHHSVTMTVGGTVTPIVAGKTYAGDIVLTVN